MCTVSWFENQDQVTVLFSRDEKKSRGLAIPPKIVQRISCQVVKPIDPDAGGSWVSVNQFGVLIGLLNLYEFQVESAYHNKQAQESEQRLEYQSDAQLVNKSRSKSTRYISRGLLINECCQASCWEDVERILLQKDLAQYKPFRLFYIANDNKKQFIWNGRSSKINLLDNFLSSSAYQTKQVIRYRKKLFANLKIKNEQSLIDLHINHNERKDPYSICTHRQDGHTVSLSLIKINKQQVIYRYWNGSPCMSQPSAPITMMLKSLPVNEPTSQPTG